MTELIIYSLIGGTLSLVGALILVWKSEWSKKVITPLLAFAAGAFLGAAFLHILPEAIEEAEEPHSVLIATVVGFTLFFILERMLMRYLYRPKDQHKHEHGEHTESLPFLVILGDSVHNFIDGIAIALAYIANPALGLTTALAVAAHEIPQEIGDATILINQGWSKKKVILVNVLQSLLTVPGALLGFYLGEVIEPSLPILLGAAAGIFLYLSASDLIPEIHHRASHSHVYRIILPFILSILVVGYLGELAHAAHG